MADKSNTGRIKKYGVCLNDKCEKYKQIQEVLHGDLECPECKKKLSPCAPPKTKNNKRPLFLGIATAVILVAGAFYYISRGSGNSTDTPNNPEDVSVDSAMNDESSKTDTVTILKTDTIEKTDTIQETVHVVDTVKIEKTIEKETTPIATTTTTTTTKTSKIRGSVPSSGNGNLQLSYGKYTGAVKGGYPHGQGRLTYSTSRQINKNDPKGRTANAGDYVIGEFFNGFVVYGKHYDAAGNLLESLTFGVGSEDSFESK